MKFICAECKREFPHGNLSQQSLAIAGTRSKVNALEVLDEYDVVCTRCNEIIDSIAQEAEEDVKSSFTSLQQWYFSGVQIDGVCRDWLNLNY